MDKKGQMFLIVAIVIISSVVIIKFNTSSQTAATDIITMKSKLENDIFENIKREFNHTTRFSSNTPTSIDSDVFDFANFTESKINEHSMIFELLYVGSIANKTTNSLNTTMINMLDKEIDGSLTLNGQQKSQNNIADYGVWDDSMTITPGNDYNMTISYDNTENNITIETKANKDVYIGFFYLKIESSDATHVDTWSKSINIR